MTTQDSRRRFLQKSAFGAGVVGSTLASSAFTPNVGSNTAMAIDATPKPQPPLDLKAAKASLRYCLNMSTINGGKVSVRDQIKIAADAGYTGVELWLRDIDRYLKEEKGSLSALRREIADLGLTVESSIAFGKWIVNDDAERKAGLETCGRDMEIIRELGGRRMAAPPVGVTDAASVGKLSLKDAARRYKDLLEVGRARDVLPQVELWGFSTNLATLEEVLFVAAGANDPDACVLLDVYHLYKGGSDFANISLVPGAKMHVLHMNDYPSTPIRKDIKDEHRVYPGDGVAPITSILSSLLVGGFRGVLSLELFNREYWAQPAPEVAKRGLEKMKAAVEAIA